MSLVHECLRGSCAPEAVKLAALKRIHGDPEVPKPEGSTVAFWQKEPHPTVARASSKTLREHVDVAIIGSGITGLSVAHTLLTSGGKVEQDGLSVVMLEARDACSGATGRNGGHILETAWDYLQYKTTYGLDAAKKLMRFRLGHLHALDEIALSVPNLKEHSQIRTVEFVSAFFDETAFAGALLSLAEFKKDMPEESKDFASHARETLSERFHLSDYAVGAITGPAGAIWPYRLVTNLIEDLQRKYSEAFSLETNTPVTAIETNVGGESNYRFTLTTPRGSVSAKHVVHCTNGYIGHLVPGFRARIVPLRGQMSAQAPGSLFPDQSLLHSWLLIYAEGYDYLTQLPCSDSGSGGEMMLGGGLASTLGHGLDEIGIARDDGLNMYADIHLRGAMSAGFQRESWGIPGAVGDMWTGIMGFSADSSPWVGRLPATLTQREVGEEGGAEWTAAGFSGEGMVNAWLSGKAVATMLLVQEGRLGPEAAENMDSWLPEQLRITEERVAKAVLPKTLAELQ